MMRLSLQHPDPVKSGPAAPPSTASPTPLNPDSQITVPPSFVELFRLPGRQRLSEPHAHIAARYELCEDLAQMLTDRAAAKRFELGITEDDVLVRMHEGLVVDGALVSAPEAWWVTQRLAELLGWPAPDLPAPPSPGFKETPGRPKFP